MQRKVVNISICALLGFAITIPFQQCSRFDFKSRDTKNVDLAKGGEGFDGKPFWSYGDCEKEIGAAEIVVVAHDFQSASLVRENCRDLTTPQSLAMSDVHFAYRDPSVFEFRGKVFDEQVETGLQKITSLVCNSVGVTPAVQTLIWTDAGSLGNLAGSVSQSNGLLSGPLSVLTPASSSPDRFVTASGQASAFDLIAGGPLSYSISGGATTNVSQMTCSDQLPPVALVQSSGAPASGSGVTYRLTTAPTESGNLLVVGLSIFDTGPQSCTIGITDNAPGGGNVYVSAGALAIDSQSGSADTWYAPNSRSGATQLTITLDARCAGLTPAVYFAEFSGVAPSNPVDAIAVRSNQPASLIVQAPSVATSTQRSVVFSVTSVQFDVTGTQSGTPFTALPIVFGDNAAYSISTTSGTYGAVWTQNNSGRYGASTVVFKAAW